MSVLVEAESDVTVYTYFAETEPPRNTSEMMCNLKV